MKKDIDSEIKVKKENISSEDEPEDKKKKSSAAKVKKEPDDDDDVDEPIESTPPTSEDEASGSGSGSDWATLRDEMVTWITLIWLNIKAAIAVLNISHVTLRKNPYCLGRKLC